MSNTKLQFVITYANGDTWEPPMGTWKELASFITEWEKSAYSDYGSLDSYARRSERTVVSVVAKQPCVTCGKR
jgi:hypothetical protein